MRAPLLVPAFTAAIVLLAGSPAEAGCIGCGGAAAPGGASVSGMATGRSYPNHHLLAASCSYSSTPSNGGHVGAIRVDALATSTFGEDIQVAVRCSVQTSAGSYWATAERNNQQSDPTQAYASDTQPATPLAWAYRICVSAEATWAYGAMFDAASVARCVYQGAGAADVDVVLPVED